MTISDTIASCRSLAEHLNDHHYWSGMPQISLSPADALGLLKSIHERAAKQGSHPDAK